MTENRNWLQHITNSIPEDVNGYSLSPYCVVLEAWRRGIKVKFVNENRRKSEMIYILEYNDRSHRFTVAQGDNVTKEAVRICKSKDQTKKVLSEASVPVPEGELFNSNIKDKKIIKYANDLSYPVVLKPSNGTAGAGVIANIKNESEFKEALNYVKYELGYKEVIVERFINGEDFRIYVIGDKVVGGIKRLPANIIGDGKLSVRALIQQKQELRNQNPSLKGRSIKIDTELKNMVKKAGYTLESIPKKGEMILLKSKNNVSAGGDSIDITDELTDEIKKTAVDAVAAIPGLAQCGVDMMVNLKDNIGAVIELNSMPHITAQLFPWEGRARDVPKAIIDYYFPETKVNHILPIYYYDFDSIWKGFSKGQFSEYVLPVYPKGKQISTRLVVTGAVRAVGYGKWVQKKARELNLNGFVKHLKSKSVSIVLSGEKEIVMKMKEIILLESKKITTIDNIEEKSRTTPVMIGFELINSRFDQRIVDGYFPIRLEGVKSNIKK